MKDSDADKRGIMIRLTIYIRRVSQINTIYIQGSPSSLTMRTLFYYGITIGAERIVHFQFHRRLRHKRVSFSGIVIAVWDGTYDFNFGFSA